MADLVCNIDEKGWLHYLNPAGRRLLGMDPGTDPCGTHLREYLFAGCRELIFEQALPAAARDGTWTGEGALHGCYERTIPACFIIIAHRRGGGRPWFSLVARDLSDLKQADELLSDNTAILLSIYAVDSVLMGTAEVTGTNIVLLSGNAATENFCGLDVESLCLGRSVDEPDKGLPLPYTQIWLQHYHDSERSGRPTRFELCCDRPDGPHWMRITISPIPPVSGQRRLFTYVLDDITELKRTQAALEQARDVAEQASRHKSQFLATMSHEIRTPMNGVLGMLGLLLDTGLAGDQLDLAQTALSSAEALLTILNDILDLSKIEAGKLTLERIDFDLEKVIRTNVTLRQEPARQKGTQLRWELGPGLPRMVAGDPGRVQQVLGNLLSNALKFTAGGQVSLLVAPDPAGQDLIRFAVSDTGIGISEEAQKRLFQSFSQAEESTTRRYGGTGLGLAICKQLTEMMGGQIGVQSMVGQGSTFWFSVPLPDSAAARPGTSLQAPRGHCLIAEDDLVSQRLAARLLQRLGYKVDVVPDGRQAALLAEQKAYDVILMDCQMPEMDGYQATREIRRREPPGRHVPIIAVTASTMAGDREICLDAGMDEYLGKPVKLEVLRDVISRLVEGGPVSR